MEFKFDVSLGMNVLTTPLQSISNLPYLEEMIKPKDKSMKKQGRLFIAKVLAISRIRTGSKTGTKYGRLILHDKSITILSIMFGGLCKEFEIIRPGDIVLIREYERQTFNFEKERLHILNMNSEYQIKNRKALILVPKEFISDLSRFPEEPEYLTGTIRHVSESFGNDILYKFLVLDVNNETKYIRLSNLFPRLFDSFEPTLVIQIAHLSATADAWYKCNDFTYYKQRKKRRHVVPFNKIYFPFVPSFPSLSENLTTVDNVIKNKRYSQIVYVEIQAIAVPLNENAWLNYSVVADVEGSMFDNRILACSELLPDADIQNTALICIRDESAELECVLRMNIDNPSLLDRVQEIANIQEYSDLESVYAVYCTIQVIFYDGQFYVGQVFD